MKVGCLLFSRIYGTTKYDSNKKYKKETSLKQKKVYVN